MLLSDWLVATLFLFVVGTENRFLVTAGRRNCAGADVALARAMRSLLWRCSACTLILSTFINFLLSTTTLAMIRRSIAGSQASTCIHGKSTNYPRLFVFFILPKNKIYDTCFFLGFCSPSKQNTTCTWIFSTNSEV